MVEESQPNSLDHEPYRRPDKALGHSSVRKSWLRHPLLFAVRRRLIAELCLNESNQSVGWFFDPL
jgi:hypothetical protein